MADLTVSSVRPESVTAEVLVLPVLKGGDGADPRVLGPEGVEGIGAAIGLTGALDEVRRIPAPAGFATGALLLTGLGASELADVSDADARRAFGAATRSLTGLDTAAIALPGAAPAQLAAAAEGALLGAYAYVTSKTKAPKAALAAIEILDVDGADGLEDAVSRSRTVSSAVDLARDLVNTPPNLLYPAEFARRAQEAVADLPITVTVLDETELAAGGYGGIVGVGQGSTRPPRLVRLDYAPAGAGQHVALVGKGITFDTGGISIKPAANMDAMTSDMTGAATVLAATFAAATLALPVHVTTYLALAENMPGGGAQRPGDVVTMRDGTTVEVLNTDAEGRMVMADALVDAVADGPDLVLDVATLTGAAVVALGTRTAAVLGTESARDAVLAAAGTVGEPFWPLPFPAELRAELDGRVADLRNVAGREGGALTAGIFLREFVGDTEWAHLDIAGPAFASKPLGFQGVGATGMSVRTVLQVLTDRSA
ncbi:leucyl aminopeptidase [Brachybacterium sp. AOP25-B2-12]|uniref:leucyl aminopeptidase n=1 Tax=Brachybacterium sp. AOP25-B2-12 TaxID=3457710 RepID=UPI0040349117